MIIIDRLIRNIGAICKDLFFLLFFIWTLCALNEIVFNNYMFLLKEMIQLCGMFLPITLYITILTWSIWLLTPCQLIAVHLITLLFYEHYARYWRKFFRWLEEATRTQKTQVTKQKSPLLQESALVDRS